jgi:peptidoglycan/xylan/chitin deacetylase (PgdA/CDA1 family)
MSAIKYLSRNFVFPLFSSLGINDVVRRLSSNNMLVLCLHGVANSNANKINGRHMLAADFDKLCGYLSAKTDVVSLDEIFEMKQNGMKPKRKTVAITFDDGYVNNLETAAPILLKHKLKATFYVMTAPLTNPNYLAWPDLIDVLNAKSNQTSFKFGDNTFIKHNGTLINADTKESAYVHFKKSGYERLEIFDKVYTDYKVNELLKSTNPEHIKISNTAQVVQLSKPNLFDIGSHTVNHFCLANIDIELAKQELQNSKTELENILQKPVTSIAYPDGSYNDNVLEVSKRVGYKSLVLVNYKNEKDKLNAEVLPRLSVSNTTNYAANIFHLSKAFGSDGF